MKAIQKTTVALLMATVSSVAITSTAMANNYHGPYIGLKAGSSISNDIKSSNIEGKADKPMVYGIYGGITNPNHLGFEVEYVKSAEADFKNKDIKLGSVKSSKYGAYGTYNYYPEHMGNLFFKGKLGIAVVNQDVKLGTTTANYSKTETATGVGAGIGIGFDLTPQVGIEAEYNYTSAAEGASDATVGIRYRF